MKLATTSKLYIVQNQKYAGGVAAETHWQFVFRFSWKLSCYVIDRWVSFERETGGRNETWPPLEWTMHEHSMSMALPWGEELWGVQLFVAFVLTPISRLWRCRQFYEPRREIGSSHAAHATKGLVGSWFWDPFGQLRINVSAMTTCIHSETNCAQNAVATVLCCNPNKTTL